METAPAALAVLLEATLTLPHGVPNSVDGANPAANALLIMNLAEMLMLLTTTAMDPLMLDFGKLIMSTGLLAVVDKLHATLIPISNVLLRSGNGVERASDFGPLLRDVDAHKMRREDLYKLYIA